MATHFRDSMSIEAVAEVLDALCAALQADRETISLLEIWTALSAKADALAQQRLQLDRAQRRARASLAVCDERWDNATAAFGRAVVDASNGRRDQAPYTRFFAKAAPSTVQGYGYEREIGIGRAFIVELSRNPDEPLAKTWIPRLTESTDTLAAALDARTESVKALGPHQTAVTLFVEGVNCELDRLEGQLKQLFAGDTSRVASVLAVTRPQRPVVQESSEPQPEPAHSS